MTTIDWTCDTCHSPALGSGAISISYDHIRSADAVRKAVADQPENAGFTRLTVADAVARPNLRVRPASQRSRTAREPTLNASIDGRSSWSSAGPT